MSRKLAGAALLAAACAASAGAAPERLELIWNAGPSPAKAYAPCGAARGDYCVPDGEWWGVCRSKQFGKAELSLKRGRVSLDAEGAASFSACPHYALLLHSGPAKRRALSPDKAKFWSEACSVDGAHIARIGGLVHLVEMDNAKRVLRLRADPSPAGARAEGLCDARRVAALSQGARAAAFGSALAGPAVDGGWRIADVMDLDGDGAPEILLSAKLKDFEPEEVGALVSAKGGALELIARTVTVPDVFSNSPERMAVHRVQRAKESCEHWGGEEPYDADRAKQIQEGADRDCGEFKTALARERARYPGNAELKRLEGSE